MVILGILFYVAAAAVLYEILYRHAQRCGARIVVPAGIVACLAWPVTVPLSMWIARCERARKPFRNVDTHKPDVLLSDINALSDVPRLGSRKDQE